MHYPTVWSAPPDQVFTGRYQIVTVLLGFANQ